jgi:hypothetical protein
VCVGEGRGKTPRNLEFRIRDVDAIHSLTAVPLVEEPLIHTSTVFLNNIKMFAILLLVVLGICRWGSVRLARLT